MGYLLLAFWYLLVVVTVSGLVLLAVSLLAGVAVAIGVGVASFWATLRDSRPKKHVPRWAEWLDDL